MIIITKDNISNYLTDQDINIIDKNINKCYYFRGLNELIKDTNNKIIYNHKYYFISYINNWSSYIIYIINNNNFNDINIYIKYKNKDWNYFNIIKNINIIFYFYTNAKIIEFIVETEVLNAESLSKLMIKLRYLKYVTSCSRIINDTKSKNEKTNIYK